jgi:hypothetical protein
VIFSFFGDVWCEALLLKHLAFLSISSLHASQMQSTDPPNHHRISRNNPYSFLIAGERNIASVPQYL